MAGKWAGSSDSADEFEEDNNEEEDEQSGSDDGSDTDSQELPKELADVPFEVLQSLRQDGRTVRPAPQRNIAPDDDEHPTAEPSSRPEPKHYKRDNKNAPVEMSSKRAVGRLRQVIDVGKPNRMDPRFADTSGSLQQDVFRKRYGFLYQKVLPEEQKALRDALKKTKNAGERKALQSQLTRLQQQLKQDEQRQLEQQVESDWRQKEREAVKAGKRPYYLKKSDKRALLLKAKFEKLKEAGSLKKYIEKRRKKNAAKDHRYVPSTRRAANE